MFTTPSAKAQATPISGSLPVICGVYCLTHIPTGKKYVGQSRDCLRRMLDHGSQRSAIGNAVRRYGRHEFHFEILSVVPQDQLLRCEAGWIALLNTNHPNGFNQTGRLMAIQRAKARRAQPRYRIAFPLPVNVFA